MTRLRRWLTERVFRLLVGHAAGRQADFAIGGHENPYILRWYVLPRNRALNVYLHLILRSDDDRALHDHPWHWLSWILRGGYIEHTVEDLSRASLRGHGADHVTAAYPSAGDTRAQVARYFSAGAIRAHRGSFAHRLEVPAGGSAWTLFITGPRFRPWGFHCPQGWVHWRDFTDPATDGATVGRGCDQEN